MARADLLVNLVRSGTVGDTVAFRRSVEGLIAEERAKRHSVLADRLADTLKIAPLRGVSAQPAEARTQEYCVEINPERRLDDLLLPVEQAALLRELVAEQHRSDLLKAHGLHPRHKVLLSGPPGNGKTSVAEALAYELMVPLLVVRYETLIGSYLGETNARLQKVFDHARTQRCVLFFDEFDVLGKERSDAHETGEIKRVVSSLLLQLDRLPSYVVTIAASNHAELLDSAVWRRFQLRLELSAPSETQLAEFVRRYDQRHSVGIASHAARIAKILAGHSYAEAEEFCRDVLRGLVLSQPESNATEQVTQKLKQWRDRAKVRSNLQRAG